MREVVHETPGLRDRPSWLSVDEVPAVDLPLARAAEKVLASMHEVLSRTRENMVREVGKAGAVMGDGESVGFEGDPDKRLLLTRSKAAELRLVRHLNCLREPEMKFRAQKM